MTVTVLLALVLMQDSRSHSDRVRAAMQVSLEKQRASIRQQVQALASVTPLWTSRVAHTAPAPCEPIPTPQLTRMIGDAAQKQGIDPALILEVARQESGFRPCAVSPKGAEGLMQLMPATQVDLQVSNPFDAKESLEAGSKLLKDLLARYHGDLSLALSAYNAGAGRVDRAGGVPEIPETQNYVVDILSRLLQ